MVYPNNDAQIFIAFFSAPASVYTIKLTNYLYGQNDSSLTLWVICFITGTIQWFVIPAFLYFILIGPDSRGKYKATKST